MLVPLSINNTQGMFPVFNDFLRNLVSGSVASKMHQKLLLGDYHNVAPYTNSKQQDPEYLDKYRMPDITGLFRVTDILVSITDAVHLDIIWRPDATGSIWPPVIRKAYGDNPNNFIFAPVYRHDKGPDGWVHSLQKFLLLGTYQARTDHIM